MPKLTRRNLLQQSPTAGLLLAGSPTRTTQADNARAQERQVDRECVIAAGMTEDEADCWVLAAQAAGKALALPELHPMERQEFASAFHVIQNRLLSRPTFRQYKEAHKARAPKPRHRRPLQTPADQRPRTEGDSRTMSDTPYLTPTDDEADRLRLHLTRWDDLDAWPKSVSVAILRGSQAVEQLVEALGVTPKQVRYGARQLQHCGLLYDGATRKYHLR